MTTAHSITVIAILALASCKKQGEIQPKEARQTPTMTPTMTPILTEISPLPPFDQIELEDLGEEEGSGQTVTVNWEGHGVIRVHVVIPDPESPVVRANYEEIRNRWPEFIETAIGEVENLIREYEKEEYPPDPAEDYFAFPVPTEPLSESPEWTFYINSEPCWVVDFLGFRAVGGQGVF